MRFEPEGQVAEKASAATDALNLAGFEHGIAELPQFAGAPL